jgi:hypothetical protein
VIAMPSKIEIHPAPGLDQEWLIVRTGHGIIGHIRAIDNRGAINSNSNAIWVTPIDLWDAKIVADTMVDLDIP